MFWGRAKSLFEDLVTPPPRSFMRTFSCGTSFLPQTARVLLLFRIAVSLLQLGNNVFSSHSIFRHFLLHILCTLPRPKSFSLKILDKQTGDEEKETFKQKRGGGGASDTGKFVSFWSMNEQFMLRLRPPRADT